MSQIPSSHSLPGNRARRGYPSPHKKWDSPAEPQPPDLIRFVVNRSLDFTAAMNTLQNNGIISDNCVTLSDVAQADHQAAINFISSHPNFIGASASAKPEGSNSPSKSSTNGVPGLGTTTQKNPDAAPPSAKA